MWDLTLGTEGLRAALQVDEDYVIPVAFPRDRSQIMLRIILKMVGDTIIWDVTTGVQIPKIDVYIHCEGGS